MRIVKFGISQRLVCQAQEGFALTHVGPPTDASKLGMGEQLAWASDAVRLEAQAAAGPLVLAHGSEARRTEQSHEVPIRPSRRPPMLY